MSKLSMLALLAIALAVPTLMLAQSTTTQPPTQADPGMTQQSPPSNPSMTQPPDQNSQSAQPEAAEPPQTQSDQTATGGANGMSAGQTMSGTISADGKSFTSNNMTYNISNPNSVKAYAGEPVSVEYEMDTNNSIRVTRVILPQPKQ